MTTTTDTVPGAADPESAADPAQSRKAFMAGLASTFGWALDLFDLFILLYVAPIIGRLFFPRTSRPCRWRRSTPRSRWRCWCGPWGRPCSAPMRTSTAASGR